MEKVIDNIMETLGKTDGSPQEKFEWFQSLEMKDGDYRLSDRYDVLKKQAKALMMIVAAQEHELEYWRNKNKS